MSTQQTIYILSHKRASVLSFTAVLSAALLVGCSSTPLENEVPVESRTPGATSATAPGSGNSAGTPQSRVVPVDLTSNTATDPNAGLARVVYFDFDSFVVKDEYRTLVERNAKVLSADRKKRVQVEGHTDERGGREYNLALGQKRAEAVAKSLALMGATDAQVEAVSFGKERPAASGSDESAWAKNRRAELSNR